MRWPLIWPCRNGYHSQLGSSEWRLLYTVCFDRRFCQDNNGLRWCVGPFRVIPPAELWQFHGDDFLKSLMVLGGIHVLAYFIGVGIVAQRERLLGMFVFFRSNQRT